MNKKPRGFTWNMVALFWKNHTPLNSIIKSNHRVTQENWRGCKLHQGLQIIQLRQILEGVFPGNVKLAYINRLGKKLIFFTFSLIGFMHSHWRINPSCSFFPKHLGNVLQVRINQVCVFISSFQNFFLMQTWWLWGISYLYISFFVVLHGSYFFQPPLRAEYTSKRSYAYLALFLV